MPSYFATVTQQVKFSHQNLKIESSHSKYKNSANFDIHFKFVKQNNCQTLLVFFVIKTTFSTLSHY